MLLTIAMALWATNLLILLLLAIAILLILTVLIQRPQGGGLSAAFGSAGSGQTAFGTKTGDALTVFTVIMFTLFVVVAIGLNFAMRPSGAPAPAVIESSTPVTGDPAPQTEPALTPAPAPGEGTGVENLVPGANQEPVTTPGKTPEAAPGTQPAGEQPAPAPAPAPTPAPATEPTPEQPETPPATDPSTAPK
jgi:preprotein translocase subunit SecG